MTTIAFLGAGNIAQAIAGGLARHPEFSLVAADPIPAPLEKFKAMGARTTTDNLEAVKDADVVVLSVKPGVVREISGVIRAAVSNKLIISVAAGITSDNLADWLGSDNIIRCMPNTPALVLEGMTGLYARDGVTSQARQLAGTIMGAVGKVSWFDREGELDAVTAVSGSGPAYFFYFIELLSQAAVELGLEEQAARELVLQTAVGAARMAADADVDVRELRRRVTSPGGTTAAALAVMQASDMGDLLKTALTAARDKSVELSQT